MKSSYFWNEYSASSPWDDPTTTEWVLDEQILETVSREPLPTHPDIEVAVALSRFTHDRFEEHGTSGAYLDNDQSAVVMRALRAVLRRLGITIFTPPFRDFQTFYKHWRSEGAIGSGSWQARRDILDTYFDPLHEVLNEREAGSITSSLATAVSPHPVTGWPRVDEEVSELRRHFGSASSQQDHSNIGNDCVAILEALSGAVYEHGKHKRGDEPEPPVASTKIRLERFVEVELPGSTNAELRKLTRSSIEFAQAVKHRRSTVSRAEAGIAADAAILLTNILRRIQLSG